MTHRALSPVVCLHLLGVAGFVIGVGRDGSVSATAQISVETLPNVAPEKCERTAHEKSGENEAAAMRNDADDDCTDKRRGENGGKHIDEAEPDAISPRLGSWVVLAFGSEHTKFMARFSQCASNA